MSHATEGDFHAYLDGALAAYDPEAVRSLESHLDRCADCRASLEAERAIRGRAGELLGTALPAVEPPPFDGIAGPARALVGRRVRVERLAWAAGIVVALGAGWMANAVSRSNGGTGSDGPGAVGSTAAGVAALTEADRGLSDERAALESAQPPGPAAADGPVSQRDRIANAPAESDAASAARVSSGAGPDPARSRDEDVARADDAAAGRTGEAVVALQAAPRVASPRGELADVPSGQAFADEADPEREETAWRQIDEDEARRILGRTALRHPDLPVVRLDAQESTGRSPRVRLTQRLPDGGSLEVFQFRVGSPDPADPDVLERMAVEPSTDEAREPSGLAARKSAIGSEAMAEARSQVDGVVVVVRAGLASDSLGVLLSRIR